MSKQFNKHLVFQSDFGVADGAVSAMTGVVVSVDDTLRMHHLTHDIPPYDIYLGSYRLYQTYSYWPKGTIFVSIVDPGVGYSQKSLVIELETGQFVVTPDNGTISHLNKYVGIKRIFDINKKKNLLPTTNKSYTFYGRDLYAFTSARLASGQIALEEVGEEIKTSDIICFDIPEVTINNNEIIGHIAIHDERYGSLWTNIPYEDLDNWGKEVNKVRIQIRENEKIVFDDQLAIGHSFQDVSLNQAIIYANSLQNVGIALNQNSFSRAFKIGYGHQWTVTVSK